MTTTHEERGLRRWRRTARRVLRRLLPPHRGGLILGYHRIADPATAIGGDPYRMCVSREAFREQMSMLRGLGRPVSLDHLLHAHEAGVSVHGMIAVTFDDGYEEVLTEALPVLEEFEVPVTVFFVSGAAGRSFWWDRLTSLLDRAESGVPLRVKTGASEFVWPGVGSRDELRVRLHRALRILPYDQREESIAKLEAAWPAEDRTRPLPRALTLEEGRRLVGSPHITAGAHSMSHPPLAEILPSRAACEISGARAALESAFGRDVLAFSYPHGSAGPATERMVREAGYTSACTSRQDSVRATSSRFLLPRVWITDRAGGAFRRRVARYVGPRARRRLGS